MLHELFITHCTNGTLIMNPFTFIIHLCSVYTLKVFTTLRLARQSVCILNCHSAVGRSVSAVFPRFGNKNTTLSLANLFSQLYSFTLCISVFYYVRNYLSILLIFWGIMIFMDIIHVYASKYLYIYFAFKWGVKRCESFTSTAKEHMKDVDCFLSQSLN